jgi:hypothetical protein
VASTSVAALAEDAGDVELDSNDPYKPAILASPVVARGAGGNNVRVAGHRSMSIKVKARHVLDLSGAENDRRMSGHDARLLPPNSAPRLAQRCRPFV